MGLTSLFNVFKTDEINELNENTLRQRPFITVSIAGNKLSALVDTGAAVSAISKTLFDKLDLASVFYNKEIPTSENVLVANGQDIKIVGKYELPVEIK